MGNRLKSQRQKLYDSRREVILASVQKTRLNVTPTRQTQQYSTLNIPNANISDNKSIIGRSPAATRSIISKREIAQDIEFIKKETFNLVVDQYYNINLENDGRAADNLDSSVASNIDNEERKLLAERLCSNLDKYSVQIIQSIQAFNLEMKMEAVTHQNWVDFCQDLENCNILPKKMSVRKAEQKKQENLKASFRTLPHFQNTCSLSRDKAIHMNQYSASATNLDEKSSPRDNKNISVIVQNKVPMRTSNQQVDQSPPQRGVTKSSSISSFLGEKGFSFNILSSNNQSNFDTPKHLLHALDDQERQLKDDLKKFRAFFRESDEIFTMFRKVSLVFQQTFYSLYGKKNEKAPKEYMQKPKDLEMRLAMELRFIIRVFEQLVERMMDHYFRVQNTTQDYNQTSAIKKSFMQSIENKAFPIINLLLSLNYEIFDRIRFLLHQVNREQTQKLKENIQLYIREKKYGSEIELLLKSFKTPFQKSIAEYKNTFSLFRKNILFGVKYLSSVVRNIAMDEIQENSASLEQLKKQQNQNNSSCLQSTSFVTPQSQAADKLAQINKMSMAKNSVMEITEQEQTTQKQSIYVQNPIKEEDDDFILRHMSKSNISMLRQSEILEIAEKNQLQTEQQEEGLSNNFVNIRKQDSNQSVMQTQCYGSEDLVPVYEYIICQAEHQLEDTLFYDIKLFLMIFDNLQDRVPQYSSFIQNISNFQVAYNYFLTLGERNI